MSEENTEFKGLELVSLTREELATIRKYNKIQSDLKHTQDCRIASDRFIEKLREVGRNNEIPNCYPKLNSEIVVNTKMEEFAYLYLEHLKGLHKKNVG